jgi:hypothetical protein
LTEERYPPTAMWQLAGASYLSDIARFYEQSSRSIIDCCRDVPGS